MEKITNERRVYESVDDKSLPWDTSLKTKNRIPAAKGYLYLFKI